jgi:hypothetical protein
MDRTIWEIPSMLQKPLIPLALAGVTLLSGAALAAAQTKTGEVKSTDATKHELVLASGDTFELAKNIKVEKFKAGDKVTVTYDMKDGKMIASKVKTAH